MKLWIDECLSPTLVERANRRGYGATCNRDRDLLGVRDDTLHKIVIDEKAVCVTNNDPKKREALWPLLDATLDYIERQAKAAAETAGEWMLIRRIEIDPSGTATYDDLPDAT